MEQKCPAPTIEHLETLKKEKDRLFDIECTERKRVQLAISLNICPVCGCPIVREDIEILNPPVKYFFGLRTKKQISWDYRAICSNDKTHHETKYDNDDYYDY